MQPVLLDTSAIISGDRWMESPIFEMLLDGAGQLNKKIAIPHIVFHELEYGFYSYLKELEPKLTPKLLNHNRRNTLFRDLAFDYNKRLENMFDDNRITVADYPTLNLDKIVGKTGAKPFKGGKEKEISVKDYIIWESFIELLTSDMTFAESFHFITGNSDDFCDGNGFLHPDLCIKGKKGQVWKPVKIFVDSEIAPYLSELRKITEQIRLGEHPSIKIDGEAILEVLAESIVGSYMVFKENWTGRIQRLNDLKQDTIDVHVRHLEGKYCGCNSCWRCCGRNGIKKGSPIIINTAPRLPFRMRFLFRMSQRSIAWTASKRCHS